MPGVPVGCKSGHKKRLMWLDGCKMGLTVESEEGEVPHLRWSQAPPLPWPRPGSADSMFLILVGGLEHFYFFIKLGMSSSQLLLTPSFFRGVGLSKPPTRIYSIIL